MTNLLDEPLKNSTVKPMKPAKRFNILDSVKNAKLKTVAKLKTAAKLIRKNANEIADWILNTKAVKQILPDKILKLIDRVKNITDSKKPVNITDSKKPVNIAALQNKLDESGDLVKLYIKKSSAFKNKAAQYEWH